MSGLAFPRLQLLLNVDESWPVRDRFLFHAMSTSSFVAETINRRAKMGELEIGLEAPEAQNSQYLSKTKMNPSRWKLSIGLFNGGKVTARRVDFKFVHGIM